MTDTTNELIAPPALRDGDTIAVVAPAGPVPMERLGPGLRRLEARFKLLVAPDLNRRSGFLAGSDARRAEEFNAALRNPDVRAIWAARGGYGCSRIVNDLDADAFKADPVPIVGFSDVTVLLCWAASLGVRSIHGPVLTQLGELPEEQAEWVLGLLQGKGQGGVLEANAGATRIEGRLLGGNLSLLAHLCGTRWAPDYRNALCILEDVGERPYAIDRYLTQLRSAEGRKTLRNAAAVLAGDFHRCEEASDSTLDPVEMVRAQAEAESLPFADGLPIGHGPRNWAFPFGARAQLDHDGLTFLESATAG